MIKRIVLIGALLALCGFTLSACMVVARPRPAVGVVVVGPPVEYDYQPLLYDGYVVYYTDDGIPYYWAGGTRIWVPVRLRARYVDHWRHHHRAYLRWHKKRGHYYRSRRYKEHRRAVKGKKRIRPAKKKRKPELKPADKKSKPRLKKAKKRPTLKPVN